MSVELEIQIAKTKLALAKNAEHDQSSHGNRGGASKDSSFGVGALRILRSSFGPAKSFISSIDGSQKGYIDVYTQKQHTNYFKEQIGRSKFLSQALSGIDSTGNQTRIRFHEKLVWLNV